MTIAKSLSVSVALGGFLALAALPATAGGHCVRAGASASAITKEVATALAKETLYQSNMMAGRKARGAASVNCQYLGVLTKCTVRQAACK